MIETNMNLSPLPDERLDEINENLSLLQLKDGLTFGTDAYLLAAFTRAKPGAVGADLGSGTGVASLLCLTKQKTSHMFAFEIQPRFADLIRRNAARNSLSHQITVHEKDIRAAVPEDVGGWIDCVIANPPYMKAGSGLENTADAKNIARREVHGTIKDFCVCASRLLRHGGYFTVVYRPERLTDLFCAMREAALEPKRIVTVCPDRNSPPSLVLVEAKKGAAPSLIWTHPLIIYEDGTRSYTEDLDRIYATCSMDFLFEKR